jgi:peptidoglycan/xylan/chitin deacetylase (PgdA/CDA1 family)
MRVALTFDTEFPGGPTVPGTEDRILAALAEANVKATFFLQGRWTRATPELARRIAEEGHLIGNHSNDHAAMNGLEDELIRRDIREAEETIRAVTGVDPRPWFRCPFGAGMDDERVLGLLEELGYSHVGWDIDPRDWEDGRTAVELDALVRQGLSEWDADAIVLLHGWPSATAEALTTLLTAGPVADAELVTVDRMSAPASAG